jgi:hypothetical protein
VLCTQQLANLLWLSVVDIYVVLEKIEIQKCTLHAATALIGEITKKWVAERVYINQQILFWQPQHST